MLCCLVMVIVLGAGSRFMPWRTVRDDGGFAPTAVRSTPDDTDLAALVDALSERPPGAGPGHPCEPHLIYPMCNAVAMVGLCAYDRLHHRDLAGDLPERCGNRCSTTSSDVATDALSSDAGHSAWSSHR
ncbi:hypothetical protein [Gordonia sp. L191]|uniref:linalool dehydratase/isomerase domain-containing protein n=1 Tax=Gordonia sp. L191 TaxID=2982699 RepID=UPI0032DF82F8